MTPATATNQSEHDHYMDLLGFPFCHEAYDLYQNSQHTLRQIANILGQTIEDVNHGINAFTNYLLGDQS